MSGEKGVAAETSLYLWIAVWAMERGSQVISIDDNVDSGGGHHLRSITVCKQQERKLKQGEYWNRNLRPVTLESTE